MQDINELIRLLEQHQIHLSRPAATEQDTDSSVFRLFEGIRTGQYATDADAASDMFPGASADHSGYFETRTALRERLAKAIAQFVAELEQYPDVQQAHFECQKLWLNVRTLSGQNAAMFALELAAHLLRIAEKFDFSLLGMDVALYLRLQHCTRDHKGEWCAEADAKHQYFQQVLEAEFQAEKMYTDLTAHCINDTTPNEELYRLAKAYSDTLAPLMRKYPAAKVHLYGNLIALHQFTASGDYSGALHHCEKAIRFFQEKPYRAGDPLQIFYYQQLLCSIHLRHIETGERAARACLELSNKNAFNQFKIKELLLLLLVHAKQYSKALALFSEVLSDPQFAFLPGYLRANWTVYEPYLAFLVATGAGAVPSGERLFAPGRPGVLDDTSPVLAFIHLLQQKRYDEARSRVPDLERHLHTHGSGAGARRSALFLNMLLQIPAGDFRRAKVIPLAAGFFAALRTTPLALANQTRTLEVVPCEDLWEMVLQTLDTQ
ncbi:MAG: hypothetical protein IPM98_00105 [Lewinellaceae bacterium]|nr:hypothetical protein [Lewinellaceae bacterium]